jgi:hypothetical protein
MSRTYTRHAAALPTRIVPEVACPYCGAATPGTRLDPDGFCRRCAAELAATPMVVTPDAALAQMEMEFGAEFDAAADAAWDAMVSGDYDADNAEIAPGVPA